MGCGLLIVGLAAFTAAMQLFWTRLDERRFPWGYPEAGRSTLVGTWVGTLTTGGGHRRVLLLDIKLHPLNFGSGRRRRGRGRGIIRRRGDNNLEGTATLCDGGREQHFTLNGADLNEAATRFRLSFATADSVPPDGFAPSHLRGSWDGGDALTFEADVYLRRGASAISSTDDPDTGRPATGAATRRGLDAFRTLCARP